MWKEFWLIVSIPTDSAGKNHDRFWQIVAMFSEECAIIFRKPTILSKTKYYRFTKKVLLFHPKSTIVSPKKYYRFLQKNYHLSSNDWLSIA